MKDIEPKRDKFKTNDFAKRYSEKLAAKSLGQRLGTGDVPAHMRRDAMKKAKK